MQVSDGVKSYESERLFEEMKRDSERAGQQARAHNRERVSHAACCRLVQRACSARARVGGCEAERVTRGSLKRV